MVSTEPDIICPNQKCHGFPEHLEQLAAVPMQCTRNQQPSLQPAPLTNMCPHRPCLGGAPLARLHAEDFDVLQEDQPAAVSTSGTDDEPELYKADDFRMYCMKVRCFCVTPSGGRDCGYC